MKQFRVLPKTPKKRYDPNESPESADEVQLEPQMHKVQRVVAFGEAQGEHVVRILRPDGPNESRRCIKCSDLSHLVRLRVHM